MTESASLQIKVWPIDRLVFYARNPRKNDAAVDRMVPRSENSGSRSQCWPAATGKWWTAICA